MADALSTIKTAYDLAKDLLELRDASERARKVGELQSLILQAQENSLSANEERSALIKTISQLEAKIAESDQWEAQKQRYEPQIRPPGVYVYALKPEFQKDDKPHCICQTCYEKGKKSVWQPTTRLSMRRRIHICPGCETELAFGQEEAPLQSMPPVAEYDPLR